MEVRRTSEPGNEWVCNAGVLTCLFLCPVSGCLMLNDEDYGIFQGRSSGSRIVFETFIVPSLGPCGTSRLCTWSW